MRRGGMFWGLVFIFFGTVLLLQTLGIVRFNVWTMIGPLFLILLGGWILLGIFFKPDARADKKSIWLDGARQARIIVRHGAGRLTVSSMTSADKLIDGAFGGGLDFHSRKNGDAVQVDLRVPTDAGWMFPWSLGSRGFEWTCGVNDAIPVALAFETGASENRFDLTNLRVTDLSIKTGASSTEVSLPSNAGNTRVKIEGGAASVVLRVPNGVGARVRFRGGLATANVDHRRFRQSGDTYETTDYATAPNKIEIDAEMGVGSLDVR